MISRTVSNDVKYCDNSRGTRLEGGASKTYLNTFHVYEMQSELEGSLGTV